MRWSLSLFTLLFACAPRTTVTPPASPSPALTEETEAQAPSPKTPAPDPLAQASSIIEAAGLESAWLGEDQQRDLASRGLDVPLATAALQELVRRCHPKDGTDCSGHTPKLHVQIMIELVDERGTPEVLPALIQLDEFGYYSASRGAEAILARQMEAQASPCAPPSADELAAARASLADFAVIERSGARLSPRSPTADELEDLAYFYAGVTDSAPGIGTEAAHASPRSDVDPIDEGQRREQLVRLSESLQGGDLPTARTAAVAYLESLGYPGPIDAAQETDRAWGGARFSYVMRDLALVSEVVGELTMASDLYLHANPGGGMCGTSVDYRRGEQMRGFIRTQERLGRCRAVVAHRLLDWEGQYDPGDEAKDDVPMGYGPVRLVRDGWDVARLYRGALLTRNRGDEAALRRALAAASDPAPLARLEREGPEHWEHRVRAAEGLADVAGREAMDELAALLPRADDPLRVRVIEAIGHAAQRHQAGPCDPSMGWLLGMGGSNIWSRPVTTFARDCRTQLSDAEAAALADRILPFVRADDQNVHIEAMQTVGKLAVPKHERRVTRWRARASKAVRAACDGVEGWSRPCQDAQQVQYAADAAFDAWARANGKDEDEK